MSVTIVIKTFERYQHFSNLLRSIADHYSTEVPIVVVDDSIREKKVEAMNLFPNLIYLRTLPDIGLSAGRNLAVDEVSTPFFVLLDDDFQFSKDTGSGIESMIQAVSDDRADLVSGLVQGQPACHGGLRRAWSVGTSKLGVYAQKGEIISEEEDLIHCQYALNFFAARTEVVASVRWHEPVKIGMEHPVFFYDGIKAGMRVAQHRTASISHPKKVIATSPRYRRLRARKKQFVTEALLRMDCDAFAHFSPSRRVQRSWGRFDWSKPFESEAVTQ